MGTTDTVRVTTEAELRELLGEPTPRAAAKDRPSLHAYDKEWIARSPFCLIGTAAADGSCDVSPKGDPPGFVRVLDDTTLAVPERPGNRRADGFRNVLSNPHVGLLFLIPGRADALRVEGRAHLVREAPYFDDMIVRGHRPAVALIVEIDTVFYHCTKALLRSELWKPETWNPEAVPSRARIAKGLEHAEQSLEELERYYGPHYAEHIYA